MRRGHRFAHRLVWPLLALVVLFGLVMAQALRPPAEETPSEAPAQESRP